MYESIGGMDTCRRLSAAFYTRVGRDPILRPLFPSLHCAPESFTLFLSQFLGGPCAYSQQRWWLSLRESHQRFKIGRKERTAWMKHMREALDEVHIEEPARTALREFFERSSAWFVNHGQAPPADGPIDAEMAARWDEQLAIEEAVAAVRAGHSDRALALAEGSVLRARFERDRGALLNLLAMMCGSGNGAMIEYVRRRSQRDPSLTHERYSGGRTLLQGAAGAGCLAIVDLLLSLGADPNGREGGHGPLYSVSNECCVAGGGDVVRALVRAGAHVDAQTGVKRCAALHMAARRGNVEVAEALLDCGAAIEARDSLGETPLRRAVNCGKVEVAALLVARGADIHAKGSKRLTPLLAARTAAMKQLLESRNKSQA